jgi:hypothetical protein
MRFRLVLAMLVLAALGAALLAVPAVRTKLASLGTQARAAAGVPADSGPRTTAQAAPPWPVMRVPDQPVAVPAGITLTGWSIVDRRTGKPVGHSDQADTATNDVESMIKPWIAADYLTRLTQAGKKPSAADLADLRTMIIRSDDKLADHFAHATVGSMRGYDAVRTRLAKVCGVQTGTKNATMWSYTTMTPDGAAAMAQCLADGRAAGAYTEQLLGWMREVQGDVSDQHATYGGGRWGIIDALPDIIAPLTSIKNGWEPEIEDHVWMVNCLAITPDDTLAIMIQYPWTAPDDDWHNATNLAQGADACKAIAGQLIYTPSS